VFDVHGKLSLAMMNITCTQLQNINVEQNSVQNRCELDAMGGIASLVTKIGVVAQRGLSDAQVTESRERFGKNSFVLSTQTSFISLIWNALCDETLVILIAAAIVSVSFGTWQDPKEGWIDGAAILCAVCIVTMVSSVNDYTKELQFRALEASSQLDERCSVLRNRSVSRINPSELVVGDVIILQAFCHLSIQSFVHVLISAGG
jgi:P-type Ca2+ transporter type 2C